MQFLSDYGLYLAETLTFVIAALVLLLGVVAILSKDKRPATGKLSIKTLNERYERVADALRREILDKKAFKAYRKTQKADKKAKPKPKSKSKTTEKPQKNLYILEFIGDIRASAVENLREEISALLAVATPKDEVVVKLNSAGGMVHPYGLAASQLARIKAAKIPLTICVDQVAASGGYLMACVADQIIAAPFAIIGSIGVVAQIPNINRLLKKNNIDFELLTAGEYKRTLTVFGENTDKARQKFKEDLNEIHAIFKTFIQDNRPQVPIDEVATGEHWLASRAQTLNLVDTLQTSDDYLLAQLDSAKLIELKFKTPKPLSERVLKKVNTKLEQLWHQWHQPI